MRILRVGSTEVATLPVLRGLVSEAARIRAFLDSRSPDAIALSISPEELAALSEPPHPRQEPDSLQEVVYMRELGRFGPVTMPPPCFVEAVKVARERGVACIPLDFPEEEFTDLYLNAVGGVELWRQSSQLRRLARSPVEAASPEAVLLELDGRLTRFRGLRRVEEAREARMASEVLRLARRHHRPAVLVEVERHAGFLQQLQERGADVQEPDG